MLNRTSITLVILLGLLGRIVSANPDALRAIEFSELHRMVPSSLVSELDDSDVNIASRAALAIGRTHAGGLDALYAHLHSDRPALRAMSAYAIGLEDDGRPGGVSLFASLARTDSSSAVRYAALDALGRMQRDRPLTGPAEDALARTLLDAASLDPDATVRGHAALQLDGVANAASAPAIVAGIESRERSERDPDVRWHLAFTLYRSYAARADGTFLAQMLHDRNELVRVETLRAFGKRANPASSATIAAMRSDPAWRVQFEAREALRALAKLPRSPHLAAMPAGIHLPPSPGAFVPFRIGTDTLGVAPFEDPRAPDPRTLPLVAPQLPTTAAGMNGPAPGPHPRVLIRTTRGDVVVRLYPEWAPSTVANFLALAQAGYFDGNRWFRIVPDFVTQTGDPTGDPDAEAGFTIPAEENPVEQRSGIIAMGLDYANGKPLRDSAGTQFYFTLSPQPYLDRDFTVFGEIQAGFATIANLVESDRMTIVRRIGDG